MDTADVYGGGVAEELLGEFMADTGSREQLVLGTKASAPSGAGPNERHNGHKHLLAALDGSRDGCGPTTSMGSGCTCGTGPRRSRR